MKFTPIIVLFLAAACSTSTPKPDREIRLNDSGAKQSFATWMDGGKVQLTESTSPEHLFVQAESAYFEGKSGDAFERYFQIILTNPDHSLTRLSTLRLYQIRNEVPDFAHRVLEKADDVSYGKMNPIAKASWYWVMQAAKFRAWKYGNESSPFDFSKVGFPARWTATPLMSPWRLRDFDVEFEPEKSNAFQDKYISPVEAVDDPRNEKEINGYWPTSLSLSPQFGKSGIYYLESFATLENEETFWLVGNFVGAAKVWIDGKLVFDRREKGYETGERFRRAKLSAGTHRILVKLAYQNGYRDWFDLGFVPEKKQHEPVRFDAKCVKNRKDAGCLENVIANGTIDFESEAMVPSQLESFYLKKSDIPKATDFMLYLSMLLSFADGESAIFDASWNALRERNPSFAAGHWIEGEQIDWRWEVPAQVREVESLKALKRAYDLDPNFRYSVALAKRIGENKTDDEQKKMLKPAFDDAVKNGVSNFGNALAWPNFLGRRGWEDEQLKAYESLLTNNKNALCSVASKLTSLNRDKDIYLDKSNFGSWIERCSSYEKMMIDRTPVGSPERLARKQRQIDRYPRKSSARTSLALELERAGQPYQEVLDEAMKVSPKSATLWSKKIQKLELAGDIDGAVTVLETYEKKYGEKAWTIWKKSLLKKEIPLQDLLKDGKAAAMAAVKKNNATGALSKDDRYFVIDFAARRYFENGASMTLTHTVTRLMTKGAIDDYAEQTLPSNAQVLRVQTIKANGEIRIPVTTPGKNTLSMPGLAAGDFVEIAYLEYSGAPSMGTSISGMRFFFQMAQISTLRSEYVIIGDQGSFLLKNAPPEAQKFEYRGLPALRFLAENNPAPRPERSSVPSDEFLPWIQMYRNPYKIDDFEVSRRFRFEQIQDAIKPSAVLDNKYASLLSSESRGDDFIKKAFYEVAQSIKSPSGSGLGTEVSHAILLEEGNPILILKALYNRAGVESDIFLARSSLAEPTPKPLGEINNFGAILLRVKTSKGYDWLYPVGLDSMYGAVDGYAIGEKAVCLSCRDLVWDEVKEMEGRKNISHQSIKGKVDKEGTLRAELNFRFEGTLAPYVRASLRKYPDDTTRDRMMQNFTNIIPGSSVVKYDIFDAEDPDKAVGFTIQIERPKYAVKTKKGWAIETHVFRTPMQSTYASLPNRTLPLFLRNIRQVQSSFEIELPFSNTRLLSKSGDFELESEFGKIERSVVLEGNTIKVNLNSQMGVQRIPTNRYLEFQAWASKVEQSSALVIEGK